MVFYIIFTAGTNNIICVRSSFSAHRIHRHVDAHGTLHRWFLMFPANKQLQLRSISDSAGYHFYTALIENIYCTAAHAAGQYNSSAVVC